MAQQKEPHKKIHAGHRQRMHQRVEKYGLESLAEHEMLEYLLYFTNAQKDTNAIAHDLLETFGDFAGVLEADEEELCTVKGIGPSSARLLHLLPQVAACYQHSRVKDGRRLRTTEQLGNYAMARYQGIQKERVLLICLSRQRRITSTAWIKQGGEDRVALPIQEAVRQALRAGAETAVLCHNHPGGSVLPSRQDLEATASLAKGMAVVGIELLDHIIVTDTEYTSLRQRCGLDVLNMGSPRVAMLRESDPAETPAPETPADAPDASAEGLAAPAAAPMEVPAAPDPESTSEGPGEPGPAGQ